MYICSSEVLMCMFVVVKFRYVPVATTGGGYIVSLITCFLLKVSAAVQLLSQHIYTQLHIAMLINNCVEP